ENRIGLSGSLSDCSTEPDSPFRFGEPWVRLRWRAVRAGRWTSRAREPQGAEPLHSAQGAASASGPRGRVLLGRGEAHLAGAEHGLVKSVGLGRVGQGAAG